MATIAAEATDRSRKAAILLAAQPVFFRYGFRKTSMDDVAKAADVSRQGLYVHFASKEDLFREMIHQGLSLHVRAARVALTDEARPIGQRLVDALNEWFGDRDKLGADSDLPQASLQIAGAIMEDHKGQFETEICRAIEKSELMSVYAAHGISASQITDALMATSRGISNTASNETFVERITVAVLILTAPCLPRKALRS
jgi:TetR/AcrR family transcriptional regulator, regulator of autoinduction and epiphytic fitness